MQRLQVSRPVLSMLITWCISRITMRAGVATGSSSGSSLPTEPKKSEPNTLYAATPGGAPSSVIGSTRVSSDMR